MKIINRITLLVITLFFHISGLVNAVKSRDGLKNFNGTLIEVAVFMITIGVVLFIILSIDHMLLKYR